MSRRLLITGFEPFGGNCVNPSWEAVQALPEQIGDFVLCKQKLSTVFGKAANQVLETAEAFLPDVILCVGVAAGRPAVTPERIAVNIRDARIPDNAGRQPRGEFVDPHGPAAYFATVPVEKMAQAICAAQLPGAVSNSAGTFVCNDTLYTLLHHYAGTHVRVGFIHVPALPGTESPGLSLPDTVAALIAAIKTC